LAGIEGLSYAGGVWYVDLASADSADLLAPRALGALGEPDYGVAGPELLRLPAPR